MYGININRPQCSLSSPVPINNTCLCVLDSVSVCVFYYYLLPRAPSLMFGCTISVGLMCVFVRTPVHVCLWYSSNIPTISSEYSVNKDYLGTSQQPSERCTWVFFSQSQQEGLMYLSGTMTQLCACHSVYVCVCVCVCVSHCCPQKEIDFICAVAYLRLHSLPRDGWLFVLPSLHVCTHVGWSVSVLYVCVWGRRTGHKTGLKSSWNHSHTS